VNDALVNQKLLSHGDVVKIGDTEMLFDDGSGRPAEWPRREEPPPAAKAEPAIREVVKEIKVATEQRMIPLVPQFDAAPVAPTPADPPAAPATAPAPSRRITQSHRMSTRRLGGGSPLTARAHLLEKRQAEEEKGVLKAFVIGVGVFFSLVIVLILFNLLTGASAEQRVSEEAYRRGSEALRRAQEASDPAAALDFCRTARHELRNVSPEFPELRRRAEEMDSVLAGLASQKIAEMHQAEQEALAQLEGRASRQLSTSQIDAVTGEIAAFRKKYADPLPDTQRRLQALEAQLTGMRGSAKHLDFDEEKDRVQEALRAEKFVDALRAVDEMIGRFKKDIDLHGKAVRLREEVMTRASAYVERRRGEARNLRQRGQEEDAKRVYESILQAMGGGKVEEFRGYVELILGERDKK
jgi:hypothetical protein